LQNQVELLFSAKGAESSQPGASPQGIGSHINKH
jgi:hypothetical protein